MLGLDVSGALAVSAQGASWQPLFDGKTLKGWHVEAKPADQGKEFWRAAGGASAPETKKS